MGLNPATWVLLRGLTRETAHWGRFTEVFEHTLPDARVLPLDLPGNGQHHAQTSPCSIAAMVASCRAELAARGEKPPFQVLAMSLGAMVATAWAYEAPHEVASCVLINTSLRPFSPFYQRLRPRNYAPLLRLALLGAPPATWEQTVLRLTSKRVAAHQGAGVLADWVATRLQRPVSGRNALRQLAAAARYRAHATPPATRLLLLASEQDPLVNADCSRTLARHWACALALHPQAGHDLPLDDPLWVARQVQLWHNFGLPK